jgi:hypothetical protein
MPIVPRRASEEWLPVTLQKHTFVDRLPLIPFPFGASRLLPGPMAWQEKLKGEKEEGVVERGQTWLQEIRDKVEPDGSWVRHYPLQHTP